jgi:hypothetical protein
VNDNRDSLAAQQAAGLRQLADMIEQNPELADNFEYALTYSGISLHLHSTNKPGEMANIARIARRHGADTTKDIDDQMYNLVLDFGGVKAKVLAYRNEVCERVVVATREVTETVPDPEALAAVPTVSVTRTVEDVDWVCRPLLAADEQKASA